MPSFLNQIRNPQVAFSVYQKHPKTVDDAVSATLEMESYLRPKISHVYQVDLGEVEAAAIAIGPNTKTELFQS